MKTMIAAVLVFVAAVASAEPAKIKVSYSNEEIGKVIEQYSKATGQKFILDPGVRGRISIFNQEPISHEEFFSQLSNGLSLNGFAISKQDEVMVIQSARNVQRNFLEVSTEVPSMSPQRMYTWIYKAKHVSVAQINRDLRILPSKDGEMNIDSPNNQIIITDWATNIRRIADIFKLIDVPADPAVAKILKKDQEERRERNHGPKSPRPPAPEKPAPKND